MVELVGHTLLDSSVGLDVNNITNLVGLQVGGERNSTVFSEVTREHVASTSTNYSTRFNQYCFFIGLSHVIHTTE